MICIPAEMLIASIIIVPHLVAHLVLTLIASHLPPHRVGHKQQEYGRERVEPSLPRQDLG